MHPSAPQFAVFLLAAASCGSEHRSAPAPSGAAPLPAPGDLAKLPTRKLIRDGEIHLVVNRYDAARRAIEERVTAAGGFVARTSVAHSAGRVSYATLVVRIPAPRFDEVLRAVLQLGSVEREATGSRDVTDEYADAAARLGSARKLEARLLGLVDTRPGKLSDLLEVERELARVREGIERLEGQVRLFDEQVELATLTVHLDVRQIYAPDRAPTLGQDARGTFGDSARLLGRALRWSLLGAIALAPWAPLWALPLAYLVRRRRRARA